MGKMRMTIQRRKILTTIQSISGHVNADVIYHQLRPELPEMSLSTVYRDLKALADMGKVSVTNMGQGWVYEAVREQPHHHLVCLGCGAVQELDHALVQPLFDQIERQGFQVASNHLCFYGYCTQCKPATEN